MKIPPPPPGYELIGPDSGPWIPPPPPGYVLIENEPNPKPTPQANNSDFARMVSGKQETPAPGFFEKGGALNNFAGGVVRGDVQRGTLEGLKQAGLGLTQLIARGGVTGELARKLQESLGQESRFDLGKMASDKIGRYAGNSQQRFNESRAGQGSAGKFGEIVGQTAPAFLVPGGQATLPARLGAAALGGAAMGAAQPVTSGDFATEKAKQVGKTAAANALGQGVIGEPLQLLARGASNAVSQATKDLYTKAKANDIPVGIPQVTKNGLLRTAADQSARLPFSGGSRRALFRQEQFNRQVAKTIGVNDAKAITSDVFDAARARIGDQFNTLSERNSLLATPQLFGRIRAVQDEVRKSSGPETEKAVNHWIERLISKADENGQIPGVAYKSFDSGIGKLAAATGGEKGYYLGKIQDAVRQEMDRSISPADQVAWQQARKQWAALKTIEPLVAKSPDGNISPALLMGAVTSSKANKSLMARGKVGALGDLAKIGQRFMKSAPDSGTADRSLMNQGIVGSAGVGAVVNPPVFFSIGGALGANNLLQRGLNSKIATDYYVNGAPRLIRNPLEILARGSGPMTGATYLEMLREKDKKR